MEELDLVELVRQLGSAGPAAVQILVAIGSVSATATAWIGAVRFALPILYWLADRTDTDVDNHVLEALGKVLDAAAEGLRKSGRAVERASMIPPR